MRRPTPPPAQAPKATYLCIRWRAATAGKPRPTAPAGSAGATSAPATKRVATPQAERPVSKKSPSTLRHQLGRADRALADAIAERDKLQAELAAAGADHKELARLGAQLAASQNRLDAAEEHWLSLADEAESLRMDI